MSDALQTALGASRPLPTDHHRRVTVEDHAAFRESIATPEPADPVEDLLADHRRVETENSNHARRL